MKGIPRLPGILELDRGFRLAFLALVFAAGQEPSEPIAPRAPPEGKDAREDCLDCAGTGQGACFQCAGSGKTQVPCSDCTAGSKDCKYCQGGHVKCSICGGSGERTLVGVGRGGQTRTVRCAATRRCPYCRGQGIAGCKKCNGTGMVPGKCTGCSGSGKETCARCGGEGKVGDLEPEVRDELPSERPAPKSAGPLETRVKEALDSIQASCDRVNGLRSGLDELSGRYKVLQDKMQAIGEVSALPRSIRGAAETCSEKWKLCETAHEKCAEALKKLADLRIASEDRAAKLRDLLILLAVHESRPPPSEDAARPHIGFAHEYASAIEDVDGTLRRLSRRLHNCEQDLKAHDEARRAHAEGESKARAAGEARSQAFQCVERLAPAIGRATGLRDFRCQLLESKSALELNVELSYFDADVPLTEGSEDAVPVADSLQKVPAAVTEVLEKCAEVARIRVRVDATRLGETGLEVRKPIQTFTADRTRWAELIRGKYKDDWEILLSKSKPSPAYPRGNAPIPEGTWPLVALLGVCVLGVAVLFVARSRMVSG